MPFTVHGISLEIRDEKIAEGHGKLNFLMKIDQLNFGKSELSAFYEDSKYALSHMFVFTARNRTKKMPLNAESKEERLFSANI